MANWKKLTIRLCLSSVCSMIILYELLASDILWSSNFSRIYNTWRKQNLPHINLNEPLEDQQLASKPSEMSKYNKPRFIVVDVVGDFQDRLHAFNLALDKQRKEDRQKQVIKGWKNRLRLPLKVLFWKSDGNVFDDLTNYTDITTIVLPRINNFGTEVNSLHLKDASNFLIDTYYPWTDETHECVKEKSTFVRRSINAISGTLSSVVLCNRTPSPLNYSWPLWASDSLVTVGALEYLHIIHDAVVNTGGAVFTEDLKIVPYGCAKDSSTNTPQNLSRMKVYQEVITVSHFWGRAVYHRIIDVLARLAPLVDFLKWNQEILIHASEGPDSRLGELLTLLGLDKNRLVKGVVLAKTVYQPQGPRCGYRNIPDIQVLSTLCREYIKRVFPKQPRNQLVLIRRTRSRGFAEDKQIETVLEAAARKYNLEFTIFSDDPTPSLNETMRLFHSAVMVVAPHGAGLVNVVFSEPGLVVIEGFHVLPYVRKVFKHLVHGLGSYYYGIPSCGKFPNKIDVPASRIKTVVDSFLSA